MNEIRPFQIWRAGFALTVTALVFIATYLTIRYLFVPL
jgi:hypothetical protein